MTIIKAASALIDDLVASGSFLANQVSACDYGVIDSSQAACVVILQPGQSTFDPIGGGGVTWDRWGITAECYIKVGGDTIDAMTKTWQIQDVVKMAVNGGTNVNCASRCAWVTSINKPFNQFYNLHGHDVIPVFVSIVVQEDP